MVTVYQHPSWTDNSANFPECHDWRFMNSPKTYAAVQRIISAIIEDFDTPERNLVPGLREALRLIALSVESTD